MSDPQEPRGHELEGSNYTRLFLGFGVTAIAIGIGVVFAVQLAYSARRDARTASELRGSTTRQEHAARVAGELEGIDAIAAAVAADPGKLARGAEPPGFVHPDKTKGVGQFTPGLAPIEPAPALEPPVEGTAGTDGGGAADAPSPGEPRPTGAEPPVEPARGRGQ